MRAAEAMHNAWRTAGGAYLLVALLESLLVLEEIGLRALCLALHVLDLRAVPLELVGVVRLHLQHALLERGLHVCLLLGQRLVPRSLRGQFALVQVLELLRRAHVRNLRRMLSLARLALRAVAHATERLVARRSLVCAHCGIVLRAARRTDKKRSREGANRWLASGERRSMGRLTV